MLHRFPVFVKQQREVMIVTVWEQHFRRPPRVTSLGNVGVPSSSFFFRGSKMAAEPSVWPRSRCAERPEGFV